MLKPAHVQSAVALVVMKNVLKIDVVSKTFENWRSWFEVVMEVVVQLQQAGFEANGEGNAGKETRWLGAAFPWFEKPKPRKCHTLRSHPTRDSRLLASLLLGEGKKC